MPNNSARPGTKQLVLLGGGHAHVHVQRSLIDRPLHNTSVTLVTPFTRQVYSGMLPGWIAGHYALDDCVISLSALAKSASVRVVQAAASRIDFARRDVTCDNGERVGFVVLSIDTGSVANVAAIDGVREHAMTVRPIERFIEQMTQLNATLAAHRGALQEIAVIGAGAGGVEIALALQFATARGDPLAPACRVTLVSAADTLPGRVASRVARALTAAGIRLRVGVAATRIDRNGVTLADGSAIAAQHVIVALGAAAAAWPRQSGLWCDELGYIVTNSFLQSVSHANVFAVGDCATMRDVARPKSGVFAVRAGSPLERNLRRALAGDALEAYTPQQRSLYLISTGRRHAIASWGPLSWQGDWVWRWKDRVDRAFIAKYRMPSA